MQAALLAQERGQPPGIGRLGRPLGRLQQQAVAVGVAAEMEDGDPVAISGVLENAERFGGRGEWAGDHLTQPGDLGRFEASRFLSDSTDGHFRKLATSVRSLAIANRITGFGLSAGM